MRKPMLLLAAIGAVVLLPLIVAGCGAAGTASSKTSPRDVEVALIGVEWKGATSTDSLAAPNVNPQTLSAGYRYKAPGDFEPGNPKRWEVSSYVWTPGAMTVFQGDRVTLTTFIINGDKHSTWVEAPDGTRVVAAQDLNRGREYKIKFTADQVGTYRVICADHSPTMRASITVLPRP